MLCRKLEGGRDVTWGCYRKTSKGERRRRGKRKRIEIEEGVRCLPHRGEGEEERGDHVSTPGERLTSQGDTHVFSKFYKQSSLIFYSHRFMPLNRLT